MSSGTDISNDGIVEDIPYVVAGADISELSREPNYRGLVEVLNDGVLAGWCFSTLAPLKPVHLELWVGDVRLVSFATSGARGDIEKLLGLPVRPQFRAVVVRPETMTAKEIHALIRAAEDAGETPRDLLSVRVSGQPVELEFDRRLNIGFDELDKLLTKPLVIPGNLDALDMGSMLRGRVDGKTNGVINGWCVDLGDLNARQHLEFYYKNVLMGVASTSASRDDINRLLNATATAGFQFAPQDLGSSSLAELLSAFAASPDDGDGRESGLAVKVAGTDCFLDIPSGVVMAPEDLSLYYDAAAAKLSETSKNRQIERSQAMLALPRTALARINLPAPTAAPSEDVKIVAFYLPQFHPFPENDEWWGEGFTEWTNVVSAKPMYAGHNQPRVPADLGYYDLRLDLVHEKQIDLARKYKVSGFCYYYYSFAGKTVMTHPIDRHVDKNYDLDFCLCWANENWSRRWDGSEDDVLMRQSHSEVDDHDFIDQVLPYFESPRYIRIDGAPLLLIYRSSLLTNLAATIEVWKGRAKAAGFPDLHVSLCETFGLDSPLNFGADSTCQFPPHGVNAKEIQHSLADVDRDFAGKVYDYAAVASSEAWRPDPGFLRFRTAMPSWDNSSRKGKSGNIFHNASPAVFEAWLSILCAKARRDLPPGKRLVFVNAWNEWAEGAYLEPDRRDGRRNLQAVRAAQSAANLLLGDALAEDASAGRTNVELVKLVASLANANRRLMEFAVDYCAGPGAGPSPFVAAPRGAMRETLVDGGYCNVEMVNGRSAAATTEVTVDPLRKGIISGWVRAPGVNLTANLPVFLQLAGAEGQEFVAALFERFTRPDVSAIYDDAGPPQHYGFNALLDFSGVPAGVYRLRVLLGSVHHPNAAHVVPTTVTYIVG